MLQNRFRKILVALDGSVPSRKGLNEAISLARQAEATVTALHVIPGYPRTVGTSKAEESKMMDRVRRFMNDAKLSAARHGLEFDQKIVKSNDIVAAISNQARSGRYDVVVIGSRGSGSPQAEYFGSVANGVLHDSSVPVLLVK